jgi:outer membrane immunogenic protein
MRNDFALTFKKHREVSMRALRVALLAAAAAFAVVPSANAADLGGGPPRGGMKDAPYYAAPSVFSWTGFYIGAHLGYGWSDVDWQAVSNSLSGSGALAGGQIGYNWQKGALVFGVEADASSSWVDGSTSGFGHSVDWATSLRGRLGVAFNDNRTMLYGTGGVAWANIDYSAPGFGGFSKTQFGWVIGGGIEHMLNQNLSARVEYLYYDLNDVTAPAGTLGAGSTKLDPIMQTVRFGINLKF